MLSALLVFTLVLLGTILLFSLFGGAGSGREGERIRDRLLGKSTAKKEKKGESELPSLIKTEGPQKGLSVKLLQKMELNERVTRLIEQSGKHWTAAGLMQAALGFGLVAFNVAWYLAPPPLDKFAWLVAVVAFYLPFFYLKHQATSRMRRFEEQFPESLEFVARSMRAGHAFSVSIEMIHREFSDPLASEYRRTFDEQNLGLPLEVALQNLAKRVPLLEVQFFVSAVLLQKRTGGNLAELLDKLAYLIRERFKLRGRIRAVSAHGRMTSSALSMIPLAVAALMFMTNKDYISFFLRDELGHAMAGIAFLMQVTGYLIMRKIVQIEI